MVDIMSLSEQTCTLLYILLFVFIYDIANEGILERKKVLQKNVKSNIDRVNNEGDIDKLDRKVIRDV